MEEVCLWSKYKNSDFLAFDLILEVTEQTAPQGPPVPSRTENIGYFPLGTWMQRTLSVLG